MINVNAGETTFIAEIVISSGFHGSFATDVACQQGTRALPDTWFRSFLGLAYVPIVETSFLELVMIFTTFNLEYPSVLSRFCFQTCQIDNPKSVPQLLCSFRGVLMFPSILVDFHS